MCVQRAALVRTWTVTAPAGSYGADRFDLSFEIDRPLSQKEAGLSPIDDRPLGLHLVSVTASW